MYETYLAKVFALVLLKCVCRVSIILMRSLYPSNYVMLIVLHFNSCKSAFGRFLTGSVSDLASTRLVLQWLKLLRKYKQALVSSNLLLFQKWKPPTWRGSLRVMKWRVSYFYALSSFYTILKTFSCDEFCHILLFSWSWGYNTTWGLWTEGKNKVKCWSLCLVVWRYRSM